MTRAWQPVAFASIAFGLLACPLHRQSAADAGSEADQDAQGGATSLAVNGAPATSASVPTLASAEPTHKHAGSRCPGGEVAILLQPGDETCVIECKSHAGCPAGWACDGEGVLSHNGRPGDAIQFCRIANRGKSADGGLAPLAAADGGRGVPPAPDAGPQRKSDVKQVK